MQRLPGQQPGWGNDVQGGPGFAQGAQKANEAVMPRGPISANLGGAGGPPTSMPGGPMDMGNRPMPGMPMGMPMRQAGGGGFNDVQGGPGFAGGAQKANEAVMPRGPISANDAGIRAGMPMGQGQQNPNLAWMNNPNPAQQRWMQEDGVFGPGSRQGQMQPPGGPQDMGNRPMPGQPMARPQGLPMGAPGQRPGLPVGNLGAARPPMPMQPPPRPMGQGMQPPQGAPMPQPGQPQGQGQGLGWMSQPNAAQQRWMNDPQNAQMMQLFRGR